MKEKERVIQEIPAKTRNELMANNPDQLERVCAYCRVSTDSDEQENSYKNQVEYYSDYISKNINWQFVGIYADEGISGKSTKPRKEFMRMIEDCEQGKIDRIVTKSISRFARNTRDSIDFVRKLRELGIAVHFQKENLNTLDQNTDLILTILSSLAEEESRTLSTNIKWTFKNNYAKGKAKYPQNYLGYEVNEKGTLVVRKNQVYIVKRIFNDFVNGQTCSEIARKLTAEKIPTPTNKSNAWYSSVIRNILQNEKYIGDTRLQKTCSQDFLSKRVKNTGQEKQWYIYNSHEAIISREQFEKVATMIKLSTENQTHKSSKYPLSSKLFCGKCGAVFSRSARQVAGNAVRCWKCSTAKKNTKLCPARAILEDEIITAYISLGKNYTALNLRDNIEKIVINQAPTTNKLTFIFKNGHKEIVSLLVKNNRHKR